MQRRRRSIPHTFEDQIAAGKARLEAQVANLPPGPQKDGLLKEERQRALLNVSSHSVDPLRRPIRGKL
jgi:hypothetical protein